MALDPVRLSTAIQKSLTDSGQWSEGDYLKSLCDAIATCVVTEITTFAEAPVTPPPIITPGPTPIATQLPYPPGFLV